MKARRAWPARSALLLAGLLWGGMAPAQPALTPAPAPIPASASVAPAPAPTPAPTTSRAGAATAPGDAPAAAPTPVPAEVQAALPQARLVGQGRLSVWGFEVYDARLWAPAGLSAARVADAPLALELQYLRAFKASDIAERSLQEMRRSQPISDAQADRWKADMRRVFPDIGKGDRILGLHRPGVGAAFWVNGQPGGEVRDADFARRFFGIWLSPATSEPRLRAALLAESGP